MFLFLVTMTIARLVATASASETTNPPNVLVFMVDDMGWNQVGFHANEAGNMEIKTPHIDHYAREGIELNRGYMTPWCGPSRASVQTGRSNSFNGNITSLSWSFDDDIGYIAGLQPGTHTLATAFKAYGEDIGKPYKTYYNGKWGIGGGAWMNSALGMGYDEFRGFWGTGIETCDGLPSNAFFPYVTSPPLLDLEFGPIMASMLPWYWEQSADLPDSELCPYFQSQPDSKMTAQEKFIACKTRPRTSPKHIDLDLVDKATDQIRTHDYNQGSWFQFFSTAAMHTPMAYPKSYNEQDSDDLPDYFQDGEVKPTAKPSDLRLATNRYVRFLDDLFGSTMQAIKDAGQWDNTIVFFTSDNGGVNDGQSVNNNYPLRSGKFSRFEGGMRVAQFMAGGWMDVNLSSSGPRVSDTYIFPMDVGPTLLQMAGADKSYLIQDKNGAVYGNELWEYIARSTTDGGVVGPIQKERMVSFTHDLFFDVREDTTTKLFYTGKEPQLTPRLWKPVYPTDEDLLMDLGYRSVQPCRPEGVPMDCCVMNIEDDPSESNPLPADCDSMLQQARELYVIEGGCPKSSSSSNTNGKQLNGLCIESDDPNFSDGVEPQTLALWSQYGAVGPFLNSRAQPIGRDLPMKCICDFVSENLDPSKVDYFTASIIAPSECFESSFFSFLDKRAAIPCDGEFVSMPFRNMTASFRAEGFNLEIYSRLVLAEQNLAIILGASALVTNTASYIRRVDFTEWPYAAKVPFVFDGIDTCREKGITPVPRPIKGLSPYSNSGGDGSKIFSAGSVATINLCLAVNLLEYFCPAHQNPLLEPVESWDYGEGSLQPSGIFRNGTTWEVMTILDCLTRCPIRAQGTAYIGDGPFGLTV